jgi:hypothetical protein
MNLPISVVPAAPAKHNQPCCSRIVKWFYPNFGHFRAGIVKRSLSALESFATIARGIAEPLDLGMFLLTCHRNTSLRCGERRLRARRNQSAFLLGKRGVKMQEERVCIRAKVCYNERDSLRHEAADEMNVA